MAFAYLFVLRIEMRDTMVCKWSCSETSAFQCNRLSTKQQEKRITECKGGRNDYLCDENKYFFKKMYRELEKGELKSIIKIGSELYIICIEEFTKKFWVCNLSFIFCSCKCIMCFVMNVQILLNKIKKKKTKLRGENCSVYHPYGHPMWCMILLYYIQNNE